MPAPSETGIRMESNLALLESDWFNRDSSRPEQNLSFLECVRTALPIQDYGQLNAANDAQSAIICVID